MHQAPASSRQHRVQCPTQETITATRLLNLDRSPARLERFRQENAHISDIVRVSAVDGAMVDRQMLFDSSVMRPGVQYAAGAIGAALSHLQQWSEVSQTGRILTVVEDDALLCANFNAEKERLLAALPEDWEFVLWGYNFDTPLTYHLLPGFSACVATFDQDTLRQNAENWANRSVTAALYPLVRTLGIACYSISPRGAKRLFDFCTPIRPMNTFHPGLNAMLSNTGIDNMMANHWPAMKAFVCVPPLVLTRNDHTVSTIRGPKDAAPPAPAPPAPPPRPAETTAHDKGLNVAKILGSALYYFEAGSRPSSWVFPKPDRLLALSESVHSAAALAQTCIGKGLYTEASALLDATLSTANTGLLGGMQALLCTMRDDTQAGLAIAQKAANTRPDIPENWLILGKLLFAAKQPVGAATALEIAAELDPTLGPAWALLALIRALGEDWAGASKAACQAILHKSLLESRLVEMALMSGEWKQGRIPPLPFDFAPLTENPDTALPAMLNRMPLVDQAALRHPSHGKSVAFIACDPLYLREHAATLVMSLAPYQADWAVHLHLYNPDDAAPSDIAAIRAASGLEIHVSTERAILPSSYTAKTYYASARFCRFQQFCALNPATPALLMDADMLFLQSPAALMQDAPQTAELGILTAPDRPFWEHCAAPLLYVRPGAAGRAFLQRVSLFIGSNLLRGHDTWFLDQVALTLALERAALEPDQVFVLSDRDGRDLEHRPASICWAVTNSKTLDGPYNTRKAALLASIAFKKEDSPPPAAAAEIIATPSGRMLLSRDADPISAALRTKGVWRKEEMDLIRFLIGRNAAVLEIGANIGAHTIPMAQIVGPDGAILAIETQPLFQALLTNVALNGLAHVRCHDSLGSIDALGMERLDLIKIDCPEKDTALLQSGMQTILRAKPFLYIRAHDKDTHDRDTGHAARDLLRNAGYDLFQHKTPDGVNVLALPHGIAARPLSLEPFQDQEMAEAT